MPDLPLVGLRFSFRSFQPFFLIFLLLHLSFENFLYNRRANSEFVICLPAIYTNALEVLRLS